MEVVSHCRKGHTAVDVLEFFKRIDASVPRALSIHVVLDNLSAHKDHQMAGSPPQETPAPPLHAHLQLLGQSHRALVQELFDRRRRRGVFTSVPDLIAAIELWATHWNLDPKPFVWHKPAAEIIEKVLRGRATLHQIKCGGPLGGRTELVRGDVCDGRGLAGSVRNMPCRAI